MTHTRNYTPPPPLMGLLALILFCVIGITVLVQALNEFFTNQP